jgi:hypothetical protein
VLKTLRDLVVLLESKYESIEQLATFLKGALFKSKSVENQSKDAPEETRVSVIDELFSSISRITEGFNSVEGRVGDIESAAGQHKAALVDLTKQLSGMMEKVGISHEELDGPESLVEKVCAMQTSVARANNLSEMNESRVVNLETTVTAMPRKRLVLHGGFPAYAEQARSVAEARLDPVLFPRESLFAVYKPAENAAGSLCDYFCSIPKDAGQKVYFKELVKCGVPAHVEKMYSHPVFMEAYREYVNYNKKPIRVDMRRGRVNVITIEFSHEASNALDDSWAVQYRLNMLIDGKWHYGCEVSSSTVVEDVARVHLETIVDLRDSAGNENVSADIFVSAVCVEKGVPTVEDKSFAVEHARIIHCASHLAPNVFPVGVLDMAVDEPCEANHWTLSVPFVSSDAADLMFPGSQTGEAGVGFTGINGYVVPKAPAASKSSYMYRDFFLSTFEGMSCDDMYWLLYDASWVPTKAYEVLGADTNTPYIVRDVIVKSGTNE